MNGGTPAAKDFPTTFWGRIQSARRGDDRALEALLGRYRGPILAFLRRRGLGEHLAEDLCQEVLLRVSREPFLEKVDPTRGRFRTLLLAVTRHVLSEHFKRERALRRGGEVRVRSESEMSASTVELFRRASAREDPAFDQLWVADIVEEALGELKDESRRRGIPYAEAFRLKYVQGLSQEEVAARLGCTTFNAKNYVYYGKVKFKQLVLAAIRAYCSTPREYEEEVRRLSPYLKSREP